MYGTFPANLFGNCVCIIGKKLQNSSYAVSGKGSNTFFLLYVSHKTLLVTCVFPIIVSGTLVVSLDVLLTKHIHAFALRIWI